MEGKVDAEGCDVRASGALVYAPSWRRIDETTDCDYASGAGEDCYTQESALDAASTEEAKGICVASYDHCRVGDRR